MANIRIVCYRFSILLGLFSIATVSCAEFDLAEGKRLVKGALNSIDRHLSNPVGLDLSSIDAAEDLDDLVEKGNNLLTEDEDSEVTSMNAQTRLDILTALNRYITNFKAELRKSGDGDTTPPLTYIKTRLDNLRK